MLKSQLLELGNMVNNLNTEIASLEEVLKSKKEELRDIKQAYSSLERIQSKYDTLEDEDEIEEELTITCEV